jgi:hypothetical protein
MAANVNSIEALEMNNVMNDTTLQSQSFPKTDLANELGEAPSREVIRMLDQLFYGIGIVAFVMLVTGLYFNSSL